MSSASFNQTPHLTLDPTISVWKGWEDIMTCLASSIPAHACLVFECYHGVDKQALHQAIERFLQPDWLVDVSTVYHSVDYIEQMVHPDVTDDRIFGYMTRLNIDAYLDPTKVTDLQDRLNTTQGLKVIIGAGAIRVCPEPDVLVYLDLGRWEIQQRMRRGEVHSLGLQNAQTTEWKRLYKQGYFVDWRVLDRLKKTCLEQIDFLLDTHHAAVPKLIAYPHIQEGYEQALTQPFSLVPFFDPGPWGGQWMKAVCDLPQEAVNYAWCFNCVPEEQNLLFQIGEDFIEVPAINLVFRHPRELMGEAVHARFGDEFPIRFDFLDTMDGGNLSLQVHPLTEYIQEHFGMHYTQDESYYIMDAKADGIVYLGFKEGIDPQACLDDLRKAQTEDTPFDDARYVNQFPAQKHDHFLIPAGTIHCSGRNTMVLEISATPYIFTFKLWDWGRVGLDGLPRPINIEHGANVLQWDRTTTWTQNHLINQVEKIAEGETWVEERTGLHEREFIETRRHWFTDQTLHHTNGTVQVVALVEGSQIIVESPAKAFKPFLVNYAEVFIVPAQVGAYTIKPFGTASGTQCATLKAFVRT